MIKLSLRLNTILDCLSPCESFADVGCDHGYVANAMLESGKCKFAYITDISAECLKKAEELLSKSFAGKYEAIVTDGLKGVNAVEQVLIAGMGGEIICDILSSADSLPKRLVLQPMKNAEKVRKTVLNLGYEILKDYTFKDEKFYDLIVCKRGKDRYTKDELAFGRDNLRDKNDAFKELISKKISVLQGALDKMSAEEKAKTKKAINKLLEVIK